MCALNDAAQMRDALQARLRDQHLQIPVQVFDEIDSTNTYAKKLALNGDASALIVALGQTEGRGRMGRSFFSPRGSGIYLSVLHTFDTPLCNAVSVTSASAVAVMRAIRRVCGAQTEIKWVNDLYYNGKKVCGILTEAIALEGGKCAVVVGIGLNLRSAVFPAELADIAGTLESDDADASGLIAAIVAELEPYLMKPELRDWLADYRACSCVLGRRVRWIRDGLPAEGQAVEIDGEGALVVVSDQGERIALRTGEITLRLC